MSDDPSELTPQERYQAAEAIRYFARDVDDERIAVPSFTTVGDPETQRQELEALADKIEQLLAFTHEPLTR